MLAEQLRGFGVEVWFDAPHAGELICLSGKMLFYHDGEKLTLEIVQNEGHFTRAILIGGMRQLIEEAAELIRAA